MLLQPSHIKCKRKDSRIFNRLIQCCCSANKYKGLYKKFQRKTQECEKGLQIRTTRFNNIKKTLNERPSRVRIRGPKIKPPSVEQLRMARDRVIAVLKKLTFADKTTTTIMPPYTKKKSSKTRITSFTITSSTPATPQTPSTTSLSPETVSTEPSPSNSTSKTPDTKPTTTTTLTTTITPDFPAVLTITTTPTTAPSVSTTIPMSQCPDCETAKPQRKPRKPRRKFLDPMETTGKRFLSFFSVQNINLVSICVLFWAKYFE